MYVRRALIGAASAVTLAGALVAMPVQIQAKTTSPTVALAAKIRHAYPWAKPAFTYASMDHRQYNLIIYEVKTGKDLSQGMGAGLMNLYISTLKGQATYTLTTYILTTHGAITNWLYRYNSASKQLRRLQFTTSGRNVLTTWYLTPGQIAQAAKVGHWPSNGLTRK